MRVLIWSVLLCAAACGGNGVDCSTLNPCGGAIAGTWKYTGKCGMTTNLSCPQQTYADHSMVAGTATFNSDTTWTAMLTIGGTVEATTPRACIQNTVTACNQLSSTNSTCTGDINVSCTCTTTLNQTINAGGSYATNAGSLMLSITGGPTLQIPYCVQGSNLRLAYDVLSGTAAVGTYTSWTKM